MRSRQDFDGGNENYRTDPRFPICRETLAYARKRRYTGWDYADGLSSEFIQAIPVESKWLNLVVQETIKRAPVNLRPHFRVEQRRNYKGAALFAMANLGLYELIGEERYGREATALVEWLLDAQIDGYSGFCGGGHRHPLQTLEKDSPNPPGNVPGVVSTVYAVQALLQYDAVFDAPEYAEVARTAADFVLSDLAYEEVTTGARIKYLPTDDDGVYTLNANALGARLLVDLYDRFGEPTWLDAARNVLDYVAAKQTAIGGWMYRDPPTASHLSMDSHHNGFIVESLLRYRDVTGSDRYEPVLDRAVEFYRDRLFEPNGAPNWDESDAYPRDIHAAAQGIIVFSLSGELPFARRIIDWTIDALYAGGGQFYYQKRRFYTKRFTLMRWCQAWMAYALSTYFTEFEARSASPSVPARQS